MKFVGKKSFIGLLQIKIDGFDLFAIWSFAGIEYKQQWKIKHMAKLLEFLTLLLHQFHQQFQFNELITDK